MHTIEELEKWVGRNKNRECLIDIDNGYGATSWQVILYGNNKELTAVEMAGEKRQTTPELESPNKYHVCVYGEPYPNNSVSGQFYDWAGLDKTIRVAMKEADKLGL